MISVVLANYNGEKYLREALQSVADQTYRDFEAIMVDDGSTDGSRTIMEDFASRYPDQFRPIFKPKNEGQAAGFNTGVAAAKGGLVCFLDSDDLWFPAKLASLVALRADFGPASLYQHNLYMMREDQPTEERMRPVMITGDLFTHTRRTKRWPFFVATSGLAFPRDILDKILPIPNVFRTCADGYLTRTAFCHGPVASRYECWGYYRVHPDNNVFSNPKHDPVAYQYGVLIPALNKYYESIGIDFRFSTIRLPSAGGSPKPQKHRNRVRWFFHKCLNASLMDIIRKISPPTGD